MSEKRCPWNSRLNLNVCDEECALHIEDKGCAIRVLAENTAPVKLEPARTAPEVVSIAFDCRCCKHRALYADAKPCRDCLQNQKGRIHWSFDPESQFDPAPSKTEQ